MDQLLVISMIALWVIVLLNFVLTLALIRRLNSLTADSTRTPPPDGLKPGEPAPEFKAETLKGATVTLSDYSGREAAFVFVSPSCSPCRAALPQYEAALPAAQRSGTDLVLVSVADAAATRAFVEEYNINIPVLVAPRPGNTFMVDYKFSSTPSYCAIDAEGKVRSAGYPNFGGGEWKALVDAWQQAKPQLANLVPNRGGGA